MTDNEVKRVFQELGPDITDETLTVEYLESKLKKRQQAIKITIMDNALLCGLGNIYACDALNEAQLSPHRPAASLSVIELAKLLAAARLVIDQGVKMGGTTFDGTYVNVEGMAGGYQKVARVYGREGEPCLQCQGVVVKTKLGGRGTYYCSVCQI